MASKTPNNDMWTENALQMTLNCFDSFGICRPEVLKSGGEPPVKSGLIYLNLSIRKESLKLGQLM